MRAGYSGVLLALEIEVKSDWVQLVEGWGAQMGQPRARKSLASQRWAPRVPLRAWANPTSRSNAARDPLLHALFCPSDLACREARPPRALRLGEGRQIM